MEASLFDRLSREVSRFGDNLTGISVLPKDIKPRRSKSPDMIRPFTGHDTSIADELKFAQRPAEGMDQYTDGNDDSSGFVTASEMPVSRRRSSITPPPPLRRRSASIRSEPISKPGSESSRRVTELSDDADTISDPSVPDCGESHHSSKDEPLPSIPAGSSPVKAPPPESTSYYSSRPHSVPLLNPELDMLSTNSTLSGTRTISGGTIVSLVDTSQKKKWVDPPVPETGQVTTPLFKSSPGSRESSLFRSHSNSCPPASTSYDNNTSVPSLKATSPIAEGQSTPTNSVEGVLRESSMRNDNLSSAPSPALRATFNVVPGSPAARKPTPDANGMPTNTTKEQADRKRIRRQFLPLIQLLVADRSRGIFHSSRSDVARALMQLDKNAYEHGGAATFKHYTVLAERAGLVILGGVEQGGGGGAWIALHSDWFSEVEKPETQFEWTNTPRKISAGCFQPLVDVLVQLHRSGVRPVLRSRVRQMLGPTVHQVAEMGGFKKYIARADKAGFVLRGGEDDDAWICLHPDLENQVDDRYQASSSASSGW
ncbi:hypothetical protein EDD15DRAFT_2215567 [Pisolithus albus]|nr:hypothetical protein EDD15DRAFT_2215567 [Pisolithus albus]